MLKQLQLRNFQAHQRNRVDFDPAVTTIIGPSDAGKSSILRALRWVLTNVPNGEAFIRKGAKGCKVRLLIDGHAVVRTRGKSGNTYELNGETFVSFGRSVPEPLQELFNVSDLNFQLQHDAPFWFADSPPEVSRQLNSIVDLGIIDKVLSKMAGRKMKKVSEIGLTRRRLERAREGIKQWGWAEEAEEGLTLLEGLDDGLHEKQARVAHLARATKEGRRYRETARTRRNVARTAKNAVSTGKEAVRLAKRVELLYNLHLRAVRADEKRGMTPPDMEPLRRRLNAYLKITKRRAVLATALKEAKKQETDRWQKKQDGEAAQAKLQKALKGRCPLCGVRS